MSEPHAALRCRRRARIAMAAGMAALFCCTTEPGVAGAQPDPPQVALQELYAAVEEAHLFADSKEFADAVPNSPPQRILAAFRLEKPAAPEALRRFVEAHFSLPTPVTTPANSTATASLVGHIDSLWHTLTRETPSAPAYSSQLPLPQAYIVPGGRFREMYYWDSYFSMLGLARSGRRDLIEAMVADFAYLIDRFDHVPNGTRTYYLSRSQPPMFFAMVALLAPEDPPAAYARYLPQLRREYAFWMRGAAGLGRGAAGRHVVVLPDGALLNRYWDERDSPRDESYREDAELARTSGRERRLLFRDIRAAAESGWDFSSRWFADAVHPATIETTQIVPVDLNSLMFGLERAIAAGCTRRGDVRCARLFERRATQRRAALNRYSWDAATGAYLDYRWTSHERMARISAATLYPLFVGLASNAQATAVSVSAIQVLLRAGGIVATPIDTGQQWDSPNGWAPLQWIAIDGLRRYGREPLAAVIACRWMKGVARLYDESGKLVEKYDVVDTGRRGGGGEYPTQDGFGWTNGVMRELMARYPDFAAAPAATPCPEPAPLARSSVAFDDPAT